MYGDNDPDPIAVKHNTITQVHSKQAEYNGYYLIIRFADFESNSNGFRMIMDAESTNPARRAGVTALPVASNRTYIQHICLYGNVSANNIFRMYVYQNSGNTINCWPGMYMILLNRT